MAVMNAEQRHTPGPWAHTDGNSEPIVTADNGETDIAMCFDLRTDEQTANARLIAAAPDMLEALELALDTLEDAGFDPHGPACTTIRAAIAKATGKDE